MNDLTFRAFADPWWPYVFILLAGWLPTDIWRYLGVVSAGRLDEHSPGIALARTIATALVAAVIARLVLYPTGSMAEVPGGVRIGALVAGFVAYMLLGRSVVLGLVVAEAVFLGVPWLLR